jgi:hypothetical protein
MAPTYRERLRAEGLTLAASGAAGSALLLTTTGQARRWPLNTAAQLAVVVALLAWLGPRGVRGSMERAQELREGEEGNGEPTPLWLLPAIVAALTLAVALPSRLGLPGSSRAGWDAGLRITAGSLIVGLGQAVLLERIVARSERATGRRYLRVKGSRVLRGTKLGWTPAPGGW